MFHILQPQGWVSRYALVNKFTDAAFLCSFARENLFTPDFSSYCSLTRFTSFPFTIYSSHYIHNQYTAIVSVGALHMSAFHCISLCM